MVVNTSSGQNWINVFYSILLTIPAISDRSVRTCT